MSPPSSESSRSPTAPAPPSSPSAQAWWTRKDDLSGQPFAWLRFLIGPLVVGGALAADPGAWRLYLVVCVVLTLAWPFCIQLTEGVEIYLPVGWTAAAAAYAIGFPVLPIVWLSATLGFGLIGVLDHWGIARAKGLAAEGLKRARGESFARGSHVGGLLRQFLYLSGHVLRITTAAVAAHAAPGLPFVARVGAGEAVVALWMRIAPVRGRVGPGSTRAKIAAALGRDMLVVTDLLGVVMTCFILLSFHAGGAAGLAAASAATIILHAMLKRLADARLESDRRRRDLLAMREALDRRQRLAAVGQTASGVFHQIARHHGTIGMFAHLLARAAPDDAETTDARVVREHAGRILASLEEAKRVIDELLRFGQDRALNLYPQSVRELVEESIAECRPQASRRDVRLAMTAACEATVLLDKHKLKQALGNVLDNAIEATPRGAPVEVASAVDAGMLRIEVRDHGPGVDAAIRARLFTPFSTTKPHGIGLGLALARELLEAHGGSIGWHDAAPGTIFVLTLPLAS